MNIEALILFIYEIALFRDIEFINTDDGDYMLEYPFGPDTIDKLFIRQLNDFIEKTYEEDKELLGVLFNNMSLLDDFIKGRYDVLEYEIVFQLLTKFKGIDGYLLALSLIDKETENKINGLVIKFLNYYSGLLELYNEEYTGYKKILQ